MKVYRTQKGYYYKEYKNGKKKRISKEDFLKLKEKMKVIKCKPQKKSIKQYANNMIKLTYGNQGRSNLEDTWQDKFTSFNSYNTVNNLNKITGRHNGEFQIQTTRGIEQFKKSEILNNHGAYGDIYKYSNRTGTIIVVIKKFKNNNSKDFKKEKNTIERLRSSRIDFEQCGVIASEFINNSGVIVMQIMNGNLKDFRKKYLFKLHDDRHNDRHADRHNDMHKD